MKNKAIYYIPIYGLFIGGYDYAIFECSIAKAFAIAFYHAIIFASVAFTFMYLFFN